MSDISYLVTECLNGLVPYVLYNGQVKQPISRGE